MDLRRDGKIRYYTLALIPMINKSTDGLTDQELDVFIASLDPKNKPGRKWAVDGFIVASWALLIVAAVFTLIMTKIFF